MEIESHDTSDVFIHKNIILQKEPFLVCEVSMIDCPKEKASLVNKEIVKFAKALDAIFSAHLVV